MKKMERRNIVRRFVPRAIDSTVKILARAWFVRERCLDNRNVEQSVSHCDDWWFVQRKGNSRYARHACTRARVLHREQGRARDSWTLAKNANRGATVIDKLLSEKSDRSFQQFLKKYICSSRSINRVGINLTQITRPFAFTTSPRNDISFFLIFNNVRRYIRCNNIVRSMR